MAALGKRVCLLPEETKSVEMVPKDTVHKGRSNSPQQFSFLQVLSFSIFTLASAFLLPTTHPPAPAMSFGERSNDAS